MKLNDAWLCAALDCQEVGEQSAYCGKCGCTQMISLASILNREFPPPAPPPLRSHDVQAGMSAARALARVKLHEYARKKVLQ